MSHIIAFMNHPHYLITETDVSINTEKFIIDWLATCMFISAFIVGFTLFVFKQKITYGRYANESKLKEFSIPARLGWFIQEIPSMLLPLISLYRMAETNWSYMNLIAVCLFLFHYVQRTLVYSYLIRGGKKLPVHYMLAGVCFTTWNGYIQGTYHALYASFDNPSLLGRYLGLGAFVLGFLINIDADARLRCLRANCNDQSYKIPRGGMFEYVSGANFFGEIIEWTGYAMFCQTMPAIAFACFTFANTAPRAIEHHNWYLKRFEDYPKNRMAVLPFLL